MDKEQLVKNKKHAIYTILGIIIATACSFYFIVYPILQFSVVGLDIYQGKHLFTGKTYLEFDYGNEFCTAIDNLNFVSENTVRDFAYYDYRRQDHLLWGKFPDFYTLDVYLGENYSQIYKQYRGENTVSMDVSDVEIILYNTEKHNSKCNQLYLAFANNRQMVRILYRTGISNAREDEISELVLWRCYNFIV